MKRSVYLLCLVVLFGKGVWAQDYLSEEAYEAAAKLKGDAFSAGDKNEHVIFRIFDVFFDQLRIVAEYMDAYDGRAANAGYVHRVDVLKEYYEAMGILYDQDTASDVALKLAKALNSLRIRASGNPAATQVTYEQLRALLEEALLALERDRAQTRQALYLLVGFFLTVGGGVCGVSYQFWPF